MKIAVIGGGLFGTTIAIHAARNGHSVELFERQSELLQCASGINQFRLHRGYHYPRSPETARECQRGFDGFRDEYGVSIITETRQLYAVARNDSRVTAAEYLRFCSENELPFKITYKDMVTDDIEVVIEAEESLISPSILEQVVKSNLHGIVNVHLGASAPPTLRQDFDVIVVAAYAGTNAILEMLDCKQENYQFEVCEKPVVRMPSNFRDIGIVVMDGEFGCVDPYDNARHLLGHVKHAIHSTNVGTKPHIPDILADDMNRGIVRKPRVSNFDQFVAAGMLFIPDLADAEYCGSMFTVRAVLVGKDETDERPTLVDVLDDQVIRVFSGKLGTCVEAAKQVTSTLDRMDGRHQSVA